MSLRLQGFDHIGISVRDVGRSLAFFRDVLGLMPIPEPPPHLVVVRGGGVEIAISAWQAGEPEPGAVPRGDHVCLRVAAGDFDRALRLFDARGIEHQVVEDRIYIYDPDGHTFELQFSG